MKTIINFRLYLIICLILSACSSDDEEIPCPVKNPGEENITNVSFGEDLSVNEKDSEKQIELVFDRKPVSDGSIKVRLHLPDGMLIRSLPEAVNNYVTIQVEKGAESASFSIFPVDDEVLISHRKISITFSEMSEGFQKANNNGMVLTVTDDELEGKPKSYSGGGITFEYFYQEDGKIKLVKSDYSGWSEISTIYSYDTDGNILSTKTEGSEENRTDYTWEDGKIIRSEEYFEGEMTSYSIYDYYSAGNIGGRAVYYKNETGVFKNTHVFVYLYFTTGNFYKQLIYYVGNDDDYQLISTRTYDNYLDKTNVFPVNEIVPGVMTQRNLPGQYRLEENGYDFTFDFTYDYNEKGYAIQRSTEGEVITFEYY